VSSIGDAISLREPTVYRPFALLALAATLLGGIPLGVWLLAWLYLGAQAVPVEWLLLHAHLQIFGFFGTLIMGVSQHLLPRFTGTPVAPSPFMRSVLAVQAIGLALRIAGTAAGPPEVIVAASLLQAAAFLLFAGWVWRMLAPRPLLALRWQLTVSTMWLAAAAALEAGLRAAAFGSGLPLPSGAGLRIVHGMALYGGVLGWVLGVLLRAGPMFVARWRAPRRLARALPGLLALGVLLAAAGEALGESAAARLGELIIIASAAALLISGGALRPARGALPMAARSPEASRIFRVAMLSAVAAVVGSVAAVAAAGAGFDVRVLGDAVRHLVTVGVLTSVVVAMAFRLIPVLEARALPWPQLRLVALGSLAAGIVLRSAEILVSLGWPAPAAWVPFAGVRVGVALACIAANLIGAIAGPRRDAGGRRRPADGHA
jgi:hypothetical protein